jgi:hypothetical protein
MTDPTPTFIPATRRRFHRRKSSGPATTPPLTLIAVGYEEGWYVRLQSNQDINIAGFVPDQITVSDGNIGMKYSGDGSYLLGTDTIEIGLTSFETTTDPGVLLWASDGTGILGTDGQTWAGCTALPI